MNADAVETTIRCHRMEPWGDVCHYDNLCFDGDVFYFLKPGGPATLGTDRTWACTNY